MIDEKRLDELSRETAPFGIMCNREAVAEVDELIRLARLGLWAKEHGIPELKKFLEDEHLEYCTGRPDQNNPEEDYCRSVEDHIARNQALAARPKEHETESNELKGKR